MGTEIATAMDTWMDNILLNSSNRYPDYNSYDSLHGIWNFVLTLANIRSIRSFFPIRGMGILILLRESSLFNLTIPLLTSPPLALDEHNVSHRGFDANLSTGEVRRLIALIDLNVTVGEIKMIGSGRGVNYYELDVFWGVGVGWNVQSGNNCIVEEKEGRKKVEEEEWHIEDMGPVEEYNQVLRNLYTCVVQLLRYRSEGGRGAYCATRDFLNIQEVKSTNNLISPPRNSLSQLLFLHTLSLYFLKRWKPPPA